MTPNLRKLIMQNVGAAEIRDAAIDEGMLTLRMDGWLKVMKGITTLEQVDPRDERVIDAHCNGRRQAVPRPRCASSIGLARAPWPSASRPSGVPSTARPSGRVHRRTSPMTAPAQRAAPRVNLRVLLEEMIERDASDLHITAGERPKLRIDGDITNSNIDFVMTPKDTLQLAYSVLTENQKKRFEMEDELDFSFGIQNLARFRGNCFKQRGCVSMVIRQIPFNIKTFDELGLPDVIREDGGEAARPRARHGPHGLGQVDDAAALLEAVAAEAREVLDAEREIQLVVHLEPLLLVLGEDGVGELQGVLRRHHHLEIRVGDLAVDSQLRALAGRDVQVRGVPLDHLLEQDTKVDGGRRLSGCSHRRGCGEPAARTSGRGTPDGRDPTATCPAIEDERARPEEHAGARCAVDHAVVSRMTCSSVVIPFMTFIQPSMRRVSIPSSTAASRISTAPTFIRTSLRRFGDIGMTS